MTSEIAEIGKFLAQTPPFQSLSDDRRAALSRQVEVRYAKADSHILASGQHNDRLFIVRSGSVELRLAGEELTARLSAGATFAYPSLLRGGEVQNSTIALEDTLLYAIPAAHFHDLREKDASFRQFFARDESERLKHALERRKSQSGFALDTRQLGELVASAAPVACAPDATINEAVALMHNADVSTLAICDDAGLLGIFTDKDIRNRVIAKNVALDRPVEDVMTGSPKTLPVTASAAEAMALMASGGFRHIPLLDDAGKLTGILSATDILSAIGNNTIDTGTAIFRAKTKEELIAAARRIPESFAAMVASGIHASHAMKFTSALGEAVHRRAVQMAEDELGPAPCAYAFVVFGSLAREEQLVGSDQDNGLIVADDAPPEAGDYFEAFGNFVSDLLNQCGFVYCKGGIMAKNPEQRRMLSGWCERYQSWIERPDEDRILRATIFFDIRHIHGEAGLTRELHERTVALFKDSPLFASYLARDALRSKVPLGIFRNLVLEKSEDGQKIFNAKRQAIMPIVDIARTHALANGLNEVSTLDRLAALSRTGAMNHDDAQSLEDAMLLVNEMRIAHQARQVGRGERPDNDLAPADLSSLERDYLKDAFTVIRDALDALRRNYAGGIA